MPKRSSKDLNKTAFSVVQRATEGKSPPIVGDMLDDAEMRRRIMREMGSRGGKKGGKARAKSLSKTARLEIAKKAAAARWQNQKPD